MIHAQRFISLSLSFTCLLIIFSASSLYHSVVLSVVGSEVALTHNKSGRFESRFVSVSILPSPAIMLKGMEGSALGVWVAHGEGESVHVKNITLASKYSPV